LWPGHHGAVYTAAEIVYQHGHKNTHILHQLEAHAPSLIISEKIIVGRPMLQSTVKPFRQGDLVIPSPVPQHWRRVMLRFLKL
jgi:hypothetical protein